MNIHTVLHQAIELKHYFGTFPFNYDKTNLAYLMQDGKGGSLPVPMETLVTGIWGLGGKGIPSNFKSPEEFINFVGDPNEKDWQVVNDEIYLTVQAVMDRQDALMAALSGAAAPVSSPPPLLSDRLAIFHSLGEKEYSALKKCDLSLLKRLVTTSTGFFSKHELVAILVSNSEMNVEQGAFINYNNVLSKKKGAYADFLKCMHEINTNLRDHGSNLRFMPTVNQMQKFGTNLASGLKAGCRPRVSPDFLYLSSSNIDEDYMKMLNLTEGFETGLIPNEATYALLKGEIPPPAVLADTKIDDNPLLIQRKCYTDSRFRDFPDVFATLVKGIAKNGVILQSKWSFDFDGTDFKWSSPGSQSVSVLSSTDFVSAKSRPFPLDKAFSHGGQLQRIGRETLEDDKSKKYLSVKEGVLHLSSTPITTDKHFITEAVAKKVMAGVVIDDYALIPDNADFVKLCEGVYNEKDIQKKQNEVISLKQKYYEAKGPEKTAIGVKLQQLAGHFDMSSILGGEKDKDGNDSPQPKAIPAVTPLNASSDIFT